VLSQRGLKVHSVDTSELTRDVEEYNTHSRVLGEFVKHFAFDPSTTAATITSMRMLRKLIFSQRAGALTVKDTEFINEHASMLNFPQRPEMITPSSIGELLTYLSPSAPAPIPDKVYMPYQILGEPDGQWYKIALCMFGMVSVSPMGDGGEFILVQRTEAAKPASVCPGTLRFTRKPLQACVQDWVGCGSNSAMRFNPMVKSKRGVNFKGDQAKLVWNSMAAWASQMLVESKIPGAGPERPAKTKRGDDDDPDAGQGGSKKRPLTMMSVRGSGLFSSSMQP
jgi:hypothetical protein